jgi:hypothetical protein
MWQKTHTHQAVRRVARDHVGGDELHVPAELLQAADMADDRL